MEKKTIRRGLSPYFYYFLTPSEGFSSLVSSFGRSSSLIVIADLETDVAVILRNEHDYLPGMVVVRWQEWKDSHERRAGTKRQLECVLV